MKKPAPSKCPNCGHRPKYHHYEDWYYYECPWCALSAPVRKEALALEAWEIIVEGWKILYRREES